MRIHNNAVVLVLVTWAALSVPSNARETHAGNNYRANHHEVVAQSQRQVPKVKDRRNQSTGNGNGSGISNGQGSTEHVAEPERWAQYVPRKMLLDEVELSEARRMAREREEIHNRQRETENLRVPLQETKGGSSARFTGEPLSSGVTSNSDSASSQGTSASTPSGMLGHILPITVTSFHTAAAVLTWSLRHLLWTPMTYAGEALRWSANTSWQTTRWTGQRALVGPAMTVSAPIIYLADGALFLFVWLPANVISRVMRELYPVYVFLGAALAVGTAMGIASAAILYAGSFLFSDASTIESSIHQRAQDAVPDNFTLDENATRRDKRRGSAARKWGGRGESVIVRAMRESREKDERARARSTHLSELRMKVKGVAERLSDDDGEDEPQRERIVSPYAYSMWDHQTGGQMEGESDEEDDYFGNTASSMSVDKGKGRAVPGVSPVATRSSRGASTPSSHNRAAGVPQLHLPTGATGHGGWTFKPQDSTSSSPASSPTVTRSTLPVKGVSPHVSANSYASSRNPLSNGPSPVASPEATRERHVPHGAIRQRRRASAG